jgi:hypothetical protein
MSSRVNPGTGGGGARRKNDFSASALPPDGGLPVVKGPEEDFFFEIKLIFP